MFPFAASPGFILVLDRMAHLPDSPPREHASRMVAQPSGAEKACSFPRLNLLLAFDFTRGLLPRCQLGKMKERDRSARKKYFYRK